ncbi:hypothetical protein Daus18300_003285 [Diaporthe australafricana]|uniref:Ankyrin repeat protein n=1 Tax=Diaporthe australafricana TaxID=127596 RepID=A0ABR3XGX6_9PEZI
MGHEGIVGILLREGAGLQTLGDGQWTPLMLATRQRHEGIMCELLHRRAAREHLQLNTKDVEGYTPLMWAIADGFLAGVRLLIEAGADCNTRTETGVTPIISASSWRRREIVLALLKHRKLAGFDAQEEEDQIDAQDEEDHTALHAAVVRGHIKVVELLLEQKANVRIRDNKGRSALHLASLQGNEAIVKMLLSTKADRQLDICDNKGMTPLHLASAAGDQDVFESSPDNVGPDDLNTEERANPEFESGRHNDVIRLLLEKGANPNATMNEGTSVLHMAAESGDHERAESILHYIRVDYGSDTKLTLTSTPKTVALDRVSVKFDELLTWAAGKVERHHIAKLLIVKRREATARAGSAGSEAWGAIEWAAYERLPKALWLLIATSPLNKETMSAVKSAKELVETVVNASQDLRDIIRDTPIALMMGIDSRTFSQPTFDKKQLFEVLGKFEAAVIQFYKGANKFGSIRRLRTVREAVYDKEPQCIIDEAVESMRYFIHRQFSTMEMERPIYMDSEPSCV